MAGSKNLRKCINMAQVKKIAFTKLNSNREIVYSTIQDFPNSIDPKNYFSDQAKKWVSAEEKGEHRVITLTNFDGSQLYYMAYMVETIFGKKFILDTRNYG